MSKKLIMITAAAALACFAGTFILGWLTRPVSQAAQTAPNQTNLASEQIQARLSQQSTVPTTAAADETSARTMTEKQLKDLIYEVREKIQEYNDRLKGLESREQRLQTAQTGLKKDIDDLNNLQAQLVSAVANIKNERDRLEKSKVEIAQIEKTNLTSIAATYDRMDATRASEILTNMCTGQIQQTALGAKGTGMDDAVKILFYMNERTKAKVFAELVTSQPQLAAMLCQKLKQVTETK